ncbi:50S ribosomal protein L4 [Eubacteriales bacterium OttesenSCG-928-M02]|nr:50S ribosomal protein L4 [Eubacteriales bacterium OttesenSCG-928-M02]
MPKVPIVKMDGKKAGEMELSDAIFGITPNQHAIHQVITAQLANRRQGTQSTLTRAEVRGGGIKPWRQKGTGRARHGSIRNPQWRSGGVVFAPKPRSYRQSVNKKVRRLAMFSVLSQKVMDGELIILDSIGFDAPKTKEMAKVLTAIKADEKTLLVLSDPNENVELSARNIPYVKTTLTGTLNVYDILNARRMVMTKDAAEKVVEVYSK